MDIQQAYKNLKELCKGGEQLGEPLMGYDIAEQVTNFFEWLQKGGFPPVWSQQAFDLQQKRNRELIKLIDLHTENEIKWVQARRKATTCAEYNKKRSDLLYFIDCYTKNEPINKETQTILDAYLNS